MDRSHPTRPLRVRCTVAAGPLSATDARTALFAWLVARQTGGSFVVCAGTAETAAGAAEELAWLGLAPSEAPYAVEERGALYRARGAELLASGAAHERDGGLWLRVAPGTTVVPDLVHGPVAFDHAALGDVALLHGDGTPSDTFAGAVDDAELAVDLVLREDVHLDQAPRQMLVLAALGRPAPRYAHVGRIVDAAGITVAGLRGAGYLPDAVVEHLALHGWSADGRESFSLAELVELFGLERVHPTPSHFDEQRLRAFNARALRALPKPRYAELMARTMQRYGLLEEPVPEPARRWIETFLEAFGHEVHTLREAAAEVAKLREESVVVPALELERLRNRQVLFFLDAVAQYVDAQPELRGLPLAHDVPAIADEFGIAHEDAFAALRMALTGSYDGPPLSLLFPLLGHDRIMIRIGAISSHVLHGRGLKPIEYGPGGVPFQTIQATRPAEPGS